MNVLTKLQSIAARYFLLNAWSTTSSNFASKEHRGAASDTLKLPGVSNNRCRDAPIVIHVAGAKFDLDRDMPQPVMTTQKF